MKPLRQQLVITPITLLASLVMAAASLADPVLPATPLRAVTKTPPKHSNLGAGPIISNACKCDLSDADALYMRGIKVRVSNVGGIGIGATEGTLRVTYYDLAGNMKVVTKPIPRLEPNRSLWIVAVDHPVIVKKSPSIVAEVIATTLPDNYDGNNKAKTNFCSTTVID